MVIITENTLEHQLCLTVGIGGLLRMVLWNWQNLWLTVGGCRAREDKVLNAVFTHRPKQHQTLTHITFIVLGWVKHRVANGCIRAKVHHCIDVMFADCFSDEVGIPVVAVHKRCIKAGFTMSKLKVVVNYDIVSALLEQQGGVRADVAGASNNENSHLFSPKR